METVAFDTQAHVKELLVISGKGGTGKTSLVGSFAALAERKVLADCDVDAADLHLLLTPTVRETRDFFGSKKAEVDAARCTGCGLCAELCRFGAITAETRPARVDSVSCEGCAVCCNACPEGAISMGDSVSGQWFVSDTPYGPLVHARLGIAEGNSGKLVAQVRREARSVAQRLGMDLIIDDGPPGIGCPVIASMSGVDLALIVTEPTVAGAHDMERTLGLARHFGVAVMVCVNKCDLNEESAREVERYCAENGVEVAGMIPFDERMVDALVRGIPAVAPRRPDRPETAARDREGPSAAAIREIWARTRTRLGRIHHPSS